MTKSSIKKRISAIKHVISLSESTSNYLTRTDHSVWMRITEAYSSPGITIIDLGNTSGKVRDFRGEAVSVYAALPSAFDALRSKHSTAVSRLIDTSYAYQCSCEFEWVAVVVIHPNGVAEFGDIKHPGYPHYGD